MTGNASTRPSIFNCLIGVVLVSLLMLTPMAFGLGTIDGYARHIKITGQNYGYIDWYEYKVFLTSPNVSTNVRAGALPGQPIENNGHFRFENVFHGTMMSILSTQPRFYGRSKVLPYVLVNDGQTLNINAETPGDYFCAFGGNYSEWGSSPWDWSTEWYQTFVATGTSINRVSYKLAGAVESGGVRVTIHRSNGGVINTWPQVGPARVAGGGAQGDKWVSWYSGEVQTTPGQTYAVRFVSEFGVQSFAFYVRNDGGTAYTQGQAYKGTSPQNYDLYATIMSDNDGTVIPYCTTNGANLNAWMWAGSFGQTWVAQGNSLAAVSFWAAGGATSGWGWRGQLKIFDGGVNGPQIGPAKVCNGAAFEGGGVGLGALSYNPGEVPLVPGRTYYLEWNLWDIDPDRGVMAILLPNNYPLGTAYHSQNAVPDVDLFLEIMEYTSTGSPTPGATSTPTRTLTPTLTPTRTPTVTPTSAPDVDGDQVPDSVEGWQPSAGQTNRYLPDSDGDGLNDGREDANRNGVRDAGETNPRDADSDDDGIEDGIEVLYLGGDPLNPASPGPMADADQDALPALLDVNDNNPDSDGDGYKDGYEAAVLGFFAVELANQKPTLGDLNGDNLVSNVDALVAQSIFLELLSPATVQTRNGDPNRDGLVTNVDGLLLQSYFLQIIAKLPL